ncbi:LuxR C-terminal-related transcriptional regulator [Idiomarina xiamenensis]|uniref:Response regulator n=1 Tax=Idiomarina xiamenensis 10-D-4 TaxID=740709 RepID=K2K839_9GAMM|nr:LuxR C-terminal-related transcriptional regulator [Idiomarina xiamenensis]EKE79074.1 response regulator [Idiomarina xiamenensis 10-D-4]
MVNFIIAVSSELVAAGMQRVLSDSGYQVQAVVQDVSGLRFRAKQFDDAVVILCSRFVGDATLETWRRIQRRHPELQLMLWSRSLQDVLDFQTSVNPIEGYLLDNGSTDDLLQACAALDRGKMFVAADVAAYFARRPHAEGKGRMLDKLSERELQVTLMLARGMRVAQIAQHLSISGKTVNTFRYRIFSKLGVAGDVALSHLAIRAGLVDIEKLAEV